MALVKILEQPPTEEELKEAQELALYPLSYKTFGVHGSYWSPRQLDDERLLRTIDETRERLDAYVVNANSHQKKEEREIMDALIQEKQRRGLKDIEPAVAIRVDEQNEHFFDGGSPLPTAELPNDALWELVESYSTAETLAADDIERLKILEDELERRTEPEQTQTLTKLIPGSFQKFVLSDLGDDELRKIYATLQPGASHEDRVQGKEVQREIERRGLADP